MLGTIKNAAQSVADTIQNALSAGLDKIKVSVEEFAASSRDLEEIGYRVCAIELCCALSPNVTVLMVRERAPTEEGFQALLARQSSNATLRTVVNLLRQTEKLIAKFDLHGHRCTNLAVELGVPPRIRLVYTDKDKERIGWCDDYII
jgi:hypothetical protein